MGVIIMKSTLFKTLIVSVITIMTTSIILTGCQSKPDVVVPTSSTVDLSAPGAYPIVKEKITLKALAIQIPVIQDIKTNVFTKWWEEKTNIHIEWKMIPSDAITEKVNLIMASGDLPDIFYGVNLTDIQESKYGVSEKLIVPLNDLIKTQAINFNKLVEKYPEITGGITNTDGKIYSMPQWNQAFHSSYANKMWINQTWLDKLGLKQPETTDDFYNVLKAFKTKDPNGNGKADEVPLAGSVDGWLSDESFIMNSFVFDAGMTEVTKRYIKNDIIDTSVNKPGYKEGLKYLAKLYKEGLLSKSSFTQKNDQVMQLAANPDACLLGATPNGASLGFVQSANQKVYRQYQAIAPLKGPEGVQQTPFFKYGALVGGKFAISKECKYPEAALRMFDMLYDKEVALRHSTGEPDKDWRWAEAGEVGINGKPAVYKSLATYNSTDPQNRAHMYLGADNATSDFRLGSVSDPKVDLFSPEGTEKMLYTVSKTKYEPYTSKDYGVLPSIKLLDSETQDISSISVELAKYISESKIKFIVGEQDIDANWDKYIKGLDNIGLKKYLEIYQKGYDRQFKKAK